MALQATRRFDTNQPPQPIVRPFTAKAGLWIHNHPRGAVLALLALAAGYGLALGLGGLSHDVFISVATVGGVVLLVSAYTLKRLIFNMSEVKRLQYLLGIDNLKPGDMVYYSDIHGKYHAITFIFNTMETESAIYIDDGSIKVLGLTQAQVRAELGGFAYDLSNPSEELQRLLHQMWHEKDGKSMDQLFAAALGVEENNLPAKFTKNSSPETGEASQEITFKRGLQNSWKVTLPADLYNRISPSVADGVNRREAVEITLFGPRFINTPFINYLHDVIKQGNYSNWIKYDNASN